MNLQLSSGIDDTTTPVHGSGTPMDIDAVRKRNANPVSCSRCGNLGHLLKDCPRSYDVRYMTTDERDDWVQHIMVTKDVSEVQEKLDDPQDEVTEDFGLNNE